MAKLIIIRGNSGSGKTTAAKLLQKELGENVLRIPQDTVRREMLFAKDGENTPALPLLTALLEYGHEHCEYTILEGILVSKWYAPLFERAAGLFGSDIHAYYYDIPFEETLKRHATRDKSLEFGEETLKSWWVDKDYLPMIEETPLTAKMSLEDTVAKMISDVLGKK